MAYSKSVLPDTTSLYTLSNAAFNGTTLILGIGGYAEIEVTKQMLPSITGKMLFVVHPSVFSNYYRDDAVSVTVSVVADNNRTEYKVPVTISESGVFNAEIAFPSGDYQSFTYRISSKVSAEVYNFELCYEEGDDVTAIIDGVEQAMPKLLYDYNTIGLEVKQQETIVGLIACYLTSPTDLQGHVTISFYASEYCNVHVRVKDNGSTELFSPQVYTVQKGYSSISIPHAYLHKKAGEHSFYVTLQCTNGRLSIPTRGLLYTIDGGYLAIRLLDAGMDVCDIAIKQTSNDAAPSEVWAIGADGGRMVLKHRAYSLALSSNWTAVKDFGEAKFAAVEFGGQWLYRDRSDKATLETSEYPMVFIVDNDENLNVYTGPKYEIPTLLAEGVDTQVSACQGFNSLKYPDQDQGLIVAYTIDGNAYYRQYANFEGAKQWLPQYQLNGNGDVLSVSVHRLPDYRVGLCVMHQRVPKYGASWYISKRTYVNQAVKPEYIELGSDANTFLTVLDADKADDWIAELNTFEEGAYYNYFWIRFNGSIRFLLDYTVEDFIASVKVTRAGANVPVKSIMVFDKAIYVETVSDVKGGAEFKVSFKDFRYIAIKMYNNCIRPVGQDCVWNLPLVYPTKYLSTSDNFNVGIGVNSSVTVTPTAKRTLTPEEQVLLDNDITLNLAVKEVEYTNSDKSYIVDIDADVTLNLTVLQTGTSPI